VRIHGSLHVCRRLTHGQASHLLQQPPLAALQALPRLSSVVSDLFSPLARPPSSSTAPPPRPAVSRGWLKRIHVAPRAGAAGSDSRRALRDRLRGRGCAEPTYAPPRHRLARPIHDLPGTAMGAGAGTDKAVRRSPCRRAGAGRAALSSMYSTLSTASGVSIASAVPASASALRKSASVRSMERVLTLSPHNDRDWARAAATPVPLAHSSPMRRARASVHAPMPTPVSVVENVRVRAGGALRRCTRR
jgi:hypothetical protein